MFYMATAIFAATFIYVASFLPETFPEEKRSALARIRPDMGGHPATTRFASLHIFEPLKMLLPARRTDGTRNWRITWCAAHTFLFTVAHSYASAAWLVLATSKYHFTPADVSNINTSCFKLIMFASDRSFPHRCLCQ